MSERETIRNSARNAAFREAVYPQAEEVRAHLARLVADLDVDDASRLLSELRNDWATAFDDIVTVEQFLTKQRAWLAAAAVLTGIEAVCLAAEPIESL